MSINSNYQTAETLVKYIKENSGDLGVNLNEDSLKELFVNTSTFNGGTQGAEQIKKQIEALEATIKKIKAEADDIRKEIDESNLDISKRSEELADIASKIDKGTVEYKQNIKAAAATAAQTAIGEYKANKGSSTFEYFFKGALKDELANIPGIDMNTIKGYFAEYDNVKGSIDPILGTINNLLGNVTALETKLKNTNATLNLLETTKNTMSDTIKNAFSNVDTDVKAPVFSGAKADYVDNLMMKYTSRTVQEGDGAAKQAATKAKDETQAKWKNYNTAQYKSGDKYSAQQNPELMNLRNAVAGGLITDLQKTGMTSDEIMTFVSSNWNVGITQKSDGTWKIPKGHSSDAWVHEPPFEALEKLVKGTNNNATAADVNQTQMKELSSFYKAGILDDMKANGFTFKEAIYTLTKLFPDAGITYNLQDQKGKANYSIVKDSSTSGSLYANLTAKISELWGVQGSTKQVEKTSSNKVEKFDPMTFQMGDKTVTFLSDGALNDGKFDYKDGTNNDLLGSKEGIQELMKYADANGNISGDALKNVFLMVNKQTENVKGGTNSVDFDVQYMTAADLGIESINLNDLMQYQDQKGAGEDIKTSTKNYDNVTEGYEDINGSSTINTFGIKMKNGQQITAKETLNTAENLQTFYGTIAEKAGNTASKVSDSQFASAFTTAYNQDVKDISEQLKSMRTELKGYQSKAKDAKSGGGISYELNVSWSDIQELYGADGQSGTYVETAMSRAEIAAESYKQISNKGITQAKTNAGIAAQNAIEEYDQELAKAKNKEENA